jgi:hypothetical protein
MELRSFRVIFFYLLFILRMSGECERELSIDREKTTCLHHLADVLMVSMYFFEENAMFFQGMYM